MPVIADVGIPIHLDLANTSHPLQKCVRMVAMPGMMQRPLPPGTLGSENHMHRARGIKRATLFAESLTEGTPVVLALG